MSVVRSWTGGGGLPPVTDDILSAKRCCPYVNSSGKTEGDGARCCCFPHRQEVQDFPAAWVQDLPAVGIQTHTADPRQSQTYDKDRDLSELKGKLGMKWFKTLKKNLASSFLDELLKRGTLKPRPSRDCTNGLSHGTSPQPAGVGDQLQEDLGFAANDFRLFSGF